MNFLEDYAIYASGDEAPPVFHEWAGLAALSACCGPNLWIDMGKFNLQPNLYIIFVGPPGIRKSTAKDVAVEALRCIQNVPMIPDCITKEALVKELAHEKSRHKLVYQWLGKARSYTKAAIMSDEFVNLVSHGGDPLGYIQFLTAIHKVSTTFEVTTLARGKTEIPYPYITLLGCITPELTSNLLNQGALSGGFSRRTLYIYSNKNGRPVSRPKLTEEQLRAKDRLISRGRMVQQLNGPFEFTPSSFEMYDKYYNENFYGIQEAPTTAIANFLQSKSDQIIKIAMLKRVSEHNDLILGESELEYAIRMVDTAQEHINSVFSAVGRNPHAATIAGILSFVDQRSNVSPHYVTQKKIRGHFLKDARGEDIDRILTDLAASEPPQIHQVSVRVGVQTITAFVSDKNYAACKRVNGLTTG